MNWLFLLILSGISLIFCAIGFKKVVWFLSVGYGFSICALGLSCAIFTIVNQFVDGGILGLSQFDLATNPLPFILILAQSAVTVFYGFRLGFFVLLREIKSAAYKKRLEGIIKKEPPIFVKSFLWISVGVLYVSECSGLIFRVDNATTDIVLPIIGLCISIIGVTLETIADAQKSAQKKVNPKMVATKGLFKMCRCPNYFGEIVFWTGIFISGISTYQNVGEWIIAVLGYICILYVMVDGTKRLEKGQFHRLKDNEEYKEYSNKTPILFPLIPLYHLFNEKKELEKMAGKEYE